MIGVSAFITQGVTFQLIHILRPSFPKWGRQQVLYNPIVSIKPCLLKPPLLQNPVLHREFSVSRNVDSTSCMKTSNTSCIGRPKSFRACPRRSAACICILRCIGFHKSRGPFLVRPCKQNPYVGVWSLVVGHSHLEQLPLGSNLTARDQPSKHRPNTGRDARARTATKQRLRELDSGSRSHRTYYRGFASRVRRRRKSEHDRIQTPVPRTRTTGMKHDMTHPNAILHCCGFQSVSRT